MRVLKLVDTTNPCSDWEGHCLHQPALATTFFMTMLIVVITSIFMFQIEHEAQPEAFPNVIATFWWAVTTLTTVGYGDITP